MGEGWTDLYDYIEEYGPVQSSRTMLVRYSPESYRLSSLCIVWDTLTMISKVYLFLSVWTLNSDK